MQSQRNGIEDDDDIELLLAHIKKVQNTAEAGTLASDKTTPSTKDALGRKGVDVIVGKMICITG